MSETSKPTVSECPNCGAPLHVDGIPLTQTQIKCEYCGTIVNIPGRSAQAPAPAQTVITINAADFSPVVETAAKGSALVGLIMSVGTFVFVAGIIVFVVSRVTNTFDSAISTVVKDVPGVSKVVADLVKDKPTASISANPFYQAALLPRGDGVPPDVVSIYREPGATETYRLLSMKPADKTVRWKGDTVSKEWYYAKFVPGQGRVYVGDGDKVSGVNADTGATMWQVSLASAPPLSCDTCVQAVGDQVVAFGRDGTLQGFDGATGKPLWSKRLDPFQGKPLDVENRLVHLEAISPTRTSLGYALNVLDAATGEAKARIEAACQVGTTRAVARSAEAYRFSPKGDAGYVLFTDGSGDNTGCVQKYDLATGKVAWSTLFKRADNFPGALASWVGVLATDSALYVSNDSGDAPTVNVLDAATGKARRFNLDKQYSYKLLDLAPKETPEKGTLIVQAKPKFDSQRTELWGVDPVTGNRKWQFILNKDLSFLNSDARVTSAGLSVLQCGNESGSGGFLCLYDKLDPHTGVSGGQVKHPLKNSAGTLKMGWSSDAAWIMATNRILGVNLSDGVARYDLP